MMGIEEGLREEVEDVLRALNSAHAERFHYRVVNVEHEGKEEGVFDVFYIEMRSTGCFRLDDLYRIRDALSKHGAVLEDFFITATGGELAVILTIVNRNAQACAR
jgi:hypothetical protein